MSHAEFIDFVFFDLEFCKRRDQVLCSLFVKGNIFYLKTVFHSGFIQEVHFLELIDYAIFSVLDLGLLVLTTKLEWTCKDNVSSFQRFQSVDITFLFNVSYEPQESYLFFLEFAESCK